jgi:hypothetical protein
MIKPTSKYLPLYSLRGKEKARGVGNAPRAAGSTVGVQVLAAVRARHGQIEQEQEQTKQGFSLPGQVTARAGLPVEGVSP